MTEIYISDRDTLEEKRARVSQTRRGTAWDGVGRAVRPRRLRLASSTRSGRTRRSGCSDTRLIIRVAVLCLSTPPAVLSAFNLWSKGGHGMRKDLSASCAHEGETATGDFAQMFILRSVCLLSLIHI